MALGDLRGRGKVSLRDPEAMGQCDRDGVWWPLSRLQRQFEWRGAQLVDTGFLVCPRCLDVPFDQNRTIILPPDPVPRVNPRPSPEITGPWPIGTLSAPTTPFNQGFSTYPLGPIVDDAYVVGAANVPNYPTDKASVLRQIAVISGVAVPPTIIERSVTLSPANATVPIMGANSQRDWLLLYSPVQAPAFFSEGNAILGAQTNLPVGPGQAWFWAEAQGLGAVYAGALTGIRLTSGLPLWAWEAPSVPLGFANDGGVLQLILTVGYPTSPIGLPPGAVWNNGLTLAVVPGVVPDPTSPALFFGNVSAFYLQLIGGGDLPLSNPGTGSGQLWNNGGMISIA